MKKRNRLIWGTMIVAALLVINACGPSETVVKEATSHRHHDAGHHQGHQGLHEGHSGHEPMSKPAQHNPGTAMMDHSAHMERGDFDPKRFSIREHAVTEKSEKGNYLLSLFSNLNPVPINKMHTWTVHLKHASGEAVKADEVKLYVNGGMPMHRHGFPSLLKSKQYMGQGDFKVEGVRFDMYGHWEMRFNIQAGRVTDRVVFHINLQPPEQKASHQWTADEMAVLNSLWIGSLPVLSSASNKFGDNEKAAELGHLLFFDRRLSANGNVACSNCHQPQLYFTDGLKTAKGLAVVERNAPTIVGAAYHLWFFHDGRADSLWSQALGPMEDRQEHGGSRMQYAHIIYNDPDYRSRYEALFGLMPDLSDKKRFPAHAGPVKDVNLLNAWKAMSKQDRNAVTGIFVNMAKAIAAYERKLKPAPARFDRYVEGLRDHDMDKIHLLSEKEQAGLKLFISKANCSICHNGPLFTDFGFHNVAIPPRSAKYDWGRYKGVRMVRQSEFNCRGEYADSSEATEKTCPELKHIVFHKEETAAAFKTPSLRNVSKTAPYMHAGQYDDLKQVMQHYAKPPKTKVGMSDLLPVQLNKSEQAQLEAFLRSLDSEIDADPKWLQAPQ